MDTLIYSVKDKDQCQLTFSGILPLTTLSQLQWPNTTLCIVEVPTLESPKLDYWLVNAKHDLGETSKDSLENLRLYYKSRGINLTPSMYVLK